MTDVFISYRRDDGGWAGRLRDHIFRRYDTFFDTDRQSLDYGVDYPVQTMQALSESRVCLAVIGPKWVEAGNLARLTDPLDWVRRELQTALAGAPRIVTVPVLVGGATLPVNAVLPEPLRVLVGARNAATVTHERWESDVEELARAVNRCLTGAAVALPRRREISPVRPYLCLCDRVEQQDAMIEHVEARKAQRKHVCVVHGHKWELPSSFVDRMQSMRALEDVLDAADSGIKWVALELNREKAKAGRYADALRRALKGRAMERPGATDAQLVDHLRALAQPLVALLQITWEDYASAPGIVAGMRDAWNALFSEVDATASTSAAVKPALLWINVTFEDDRQALAESDVADALPQLSPLKDGHIADWLAMTKVKEVVAGYETRILALSDDERYRAPRGRLRMQSFVDEVLRIVPAD